MKIKIAANKKRKPSFWEELYKNQAVESMPWFSPKLDHDFARSLKKLKLKPKGTLVLDLGTGPGTQAIAMAKLGFRVTGTDISASAVRKAKARAKKEGCRVSFRKDDVLKPKLKNKFDLILDRGCFHTLEPEDRPRYVNNIQRLLAPGGLLFLKTFSHKERFDQGPFRFKPAEIRQYFSCLRQTGEKSFKILSIRGSRFKSVRKPNPIALFCILRRP